MDKKKFVIFGEGKGWFNALFAECYGDSNIIIGNDCFSPYSDNIIQKFFYHFIFSRRLGKDKRQDLFSKCVLNRLCRQIHIKNKGGCICIFNRTNHLSHNRYFLMELKRLVPSAILIYWYTDIVDQVIKSEPDLLNICNECYDKVITYDPYDAENYGYEYVETPYSVIKNNHKSDNELYDLIYIGSAKINVDRERYKTIIRIFEKAKECGLSVKFYIHGVPDSQQEYPDEIIYNKYFDYNDVVKLVEKSKCILEVSQKDETGTTLRFFEAIAYNKRLLMTNKALIHHPYFNDKYMKIIDTDEEDINICVDFIRDKEKANYDCKQLLSPYLFLDKVMAIANTRQ